MGDASRLSWGALIDIEPLAPRQVLFVDDDLHICIFAGDIGATDPGLTLARAAHLVIILAADGRFSSCRVSKPSIDTSISDMSA